jgi:8-oxo-dGTP pyrophosphatase MutT (NUDIX family)
VSYEYASIIALAGFLASSGSTRTMSSERSSPMKTATLALNVKDSKVLLGTKKTGEIGKGTINAPGGKCNPGELPIECVVRETSEEVGIVLDPENITLTAVITFFADNAADFEVYVFRAETFSGEPRETEEMVPEWFTISEIPFGRMLESDFAWFPRALNGTPFRAQVHYTGRAIGYQYIEFFPM